MIFLQEKQNRQYLMFFFALCVSFFLIMLFSDYTQLRFTGDLIYLKEQQMVSVLLEEGVPASVLADACSETEVTQAGADFLCRIGHSFGTPLYFLPFVKEYIRTVFLPDGLYLLLFIGICLWGILRYMKQRERLYQNAADTVECFAEGDFSGHLPWNQTGTFYRLFASIDQLAKALQTKCESEHASGEFLKNTVSDISHQLKTPLAALQMYTEIISAEPEQPETVRKFSLKTMQSLIRMEDLIQNLLKMMRMDAGSIHFEKKCILVRQLVEGAAENLRTRAQQEKKQLLLDGSPKALIHCDPIWTQEAVGNLIKNALDHTYEGGTIRILWEQSPAMVRLSVEDNGTGILPEDIHHIFKRFYRSRQSSDRQGAGLGLPLAKSVVEGQSGVLSVRSEPGAGTTFLISFPVQEEEESLRNRKLKFTGM